MILDHASRIHNIGLSSISSAGVREMGCAWFGLRLDMGSMARIAEVVASLSVMIARTALCINI